MKRIRIADAKAHLSQLVSGLSFGEEVIITRHGVAVAKLSAVVDSDILLKRDTASRIRANAKSLGAGSFSEAELLGYVHQGRR